MSKVLLSAEDFETVRRRVAQLQKENEFLKNRVGRLLASLNKDSLSKKNFRDALEDLGNYLIPEG